jgi:hypothetical protein
MATLPNKKESLSSSSTIQQWFIKALAKEKELSEAKVSVLQLALRQTLQPIAIIEEQWTKLDLALSVEPVLTDLSSSLDFFISVRDRNFKSVPLAPKIRINSTGLFVSELKPSVFNEKDNEYYFFGSFVNSLQVGIWSVEIFFPSSTAEKKDIPVSIVDQTTIWIAEWQWIASTEPNSPQPLMS